MPKEVNALLPGFLFRVTLYCVRVLLGRRPGIKDWRQQRREMVALLKRMGIQDSLVLQAMGVVERHRFVPLKHRYQRLEDPYCNHPLPIGYDQTISQPFVVAYMLEKLKLVPGEKVLEIGTGSGYVAAVLDEMGLKVFTVEIVKELAIGAEKVMGSKVHMRMGNGYEGWPEEAPFDAIILSCAPRSIPDNLTTQLKDGGRMILPTGDRDQRLVMVTRAGADITMQEDIPVRFVPMVHR